MVVIKKQLVSDEVIKKRSYGYGNAKKYITIHETDNTDPGANAQAHANLQSRLNPRQASWHWQVDDKEAIQSFPHEVQCWAGGDGRGPGNTQSIHVEICVNSDGNYEKAVQNAVELVKQIMKEEDIPISNVVQHNRWSGKNCPKRMRKENRWNQFLQMIQDSSKPSVSSSIILRFGDKGEAVRKLQEDLIKAGEQLPRYGVDGYFGAETLEAVKSFQKKHGLTVDGIAGPATLAKLAEVITGQNQQKKEEAKKDMLKAAVVINSFADFPAAEAVATRYKAPIFLRPFATGEIAETVYIVGGSAEGIKAKKVVKLSGANRFETAKRVGEYLGSIKS